MLFPHLQFVVVMSIRFTGGVLKGIETTTDCKFATQADAFDYAEAMDGKHCNSFGSPFDVLSVVVKPRAAA